MLEVLYSAVTTGLIGVRTKNFNNAISYLRKDGK